MEVELSVSPCGEIQCGYRLQAQPGSIVLPRAGSMLDSERLWEHTCCELFVGAQANREYDEWNFSPTGQYAHFEFDRYRNRRAGSVRPAAAPSLDVTVEPDRLELVGRVPAETQMLLRLAPTVVVEHPGDKRSFWALYHPAADPDFHHADGFVVSVAPAA